VFENYQVAVRISLVNHVSGALALMTGQFAATDKAAALLQKRLTSIQMMAKGGAYLLGGAGALAAPFIFAIDKAAELQKQMIAIQLATRGTATEMNNMRSAIEGVASKTIFSNIDVAKMGKQIATGTGLSAQGVTSLLPIFGQFADVQTLMKGTGYQESTNTLIRLAHLANHYDAPGVAKYADLLTKASFVVPGGLGEVAHGLQYFQGVAKNTLGMSDDDTVLAVALANRMGIKGSRGGTALTAAITRTIPGIFGSGLLKGKSFEALSAMGMVDGSGHAKVFKDGKFDMMTWMGLMGEYVQKEFASHPEAIARQDIMKNFQHAYGVNGSRLGSTFSTGQALEQWQQIGAQFQLGGGAEAMQKRFADESVAQQWINAKTNFISAMTEMGITLLPMASRALKALNSELAKVINWIMKHQEATKTLAKAFLVLSATMAFSGTVLILTAAFRGLFLALQFSAVGAVAPLARLVAGLGGLSGGAGALALGLAGRTAGLGLAVGAGVGLGAAVDHFFPNNWLAQFGHFLGNTAFDLTHDDFDPNAHPYIKPNGGAQGPAQTSSVFLDGRKVGTIISEHQAKAFKQPQTGINGLDTSSFLIPAGGL
jgi:hypothetical protein